MRWIIVIAIILAPIAVLVIGIGIYAVQQIAGW